MYLFDHLKGRMSTRNIVACMGLMTIAMLTFMLTASPVHAAAPTAFTSQTYSDANSNGAVETITLVVNGGEALTTCTVDATELSTDWTYTGNDIGGTIASATCDTGTATITFTITGATAGVTGHSTAPTIAYDNDDTDNSIANASGNLGAVGAANVSDGAKPQIKTFAYKDADGDGKADTVTATYTETVTAASVLRAADLTFSAVGDFTAAAFGGATTDLITGSVTSTDIAFGTESSAVDTRENAGTIAITSQANFSLTDGTNTNSTLGAQSQATFLDSMKPVITAVTPASGATVTNRSVVVTLTFSEAMDPNFDLDTEFAVTPVLTNAAWTDAWTVSNTVVTLTHTAPFLCTKSYNFVITAAQAVAAAGESGFTASLLTGPEDGDWTFTTTNSGCTNTGSNTQAQTYGVSLTSPNGGEAYSAGSVKTISWTDTSVNATVPYVNLSYSLNGGSYTSIVTGIANTGSYNWTIPLMSGSVMVKVEATDLATVLASDVSNATFAVTNATDSDVEDTDSDDEVVDDEIVDDTEDRLPAGTMIKSPSFSSVYYIDSTGKRRPFLNSTVYFTWADSFANVQLVSNEVLASYTLGSPMLPKAGTVLVKIESVSAVYAITGSNTLRWIMTEDIARDLYGANWADYVIDMPVTMWGKFIVGEQINSANDLAVTLSDMRTRTWLGSR